MCRLPLITVEGSADDQPLDLAGALVQPKQPDLAVDPLDRDFPHVPGAAVHLHREIGHPAAISVQKSLAADGATRRSAPLS